MYTHTLIEDFWPFILFTCNILNSLAMVFTVAGYPSQDIILCPLEFFTLILSKIGYFICYKIFNQKYSLFSNVIKFELFCPTNSWTFFKNHELGNNLQPVQYSQFSSRSKFRYRSTSSRLFESNHGKSHGKR